MATRDTGKRSLLKSLTWRLIGALDTALIAWVITGNPMSGLNMGVADAVTKIVFYIIHEQLWNTVDLDKHKGLKKNRNRGLHWYKAIVWRLFSSGLTVILGWVILNDPVTGLKIGGIEVFTKIILYYGHERLWSRTTYGVKTTK